MAHAEIDFAGHRGEEEDGDRNREKDKFARTRFPESGREESEQKKEEQRERSFNENRDGKVVPDAGGKFVAEDEGGAGAVVDDVEEPGEVGLGKEVEADDGCDRMAKRSGSAAICLQSLRNFEASGMARQSRIAELIGGPKNRDSDQAGAEPSGRKPRNRLPRRRVAIEPSAGRKLQKKNEGDENARMFGSERQPEHETK